VNELHTLGLSLRLGTDGRDSLIWPQDEGQTLRPA